MNKKIEKKTGKLFTILYEDVYMGELTFLGSEFVKWLIFEDEHVFVAFRYVHIDTDSHVAKVAPIYAKKNIRHYEDGELSHITTKRVNLNKTLSRVKRWI